MAGCGLRVSERWWCGEGRSGGCGSQEPRRPAGRERGGRGGGGGGEADRQTITRRLPLTLPLLIAIQRARCGLVNPLDVNCLAYTNSVQMAARTALTCTRTDADDADKLHRKRANNEKRKHGFGPRGVPDRNHLFWRPDAPPRPASPCEAPPRCPHPRPAPPPTRSPHRFPIARASPKFITRHREH